MEYVRNDGRVFWLGGNVHDTTFVLTMTAGRCVWKIATTGDDENMVTRSFESLRADCRIDPRRFLLTSRRRA